MTGSLGDFVGGMWAGSLYVPFTLFALRFAAPSRGRMANLSFWRLLRDVFVGDFCLALPLFLVFPATTDALVWKSVAAWLGSGLAGLFFVLCWGFASTRDTTGEARRYYRSIFLMEAVAVLAVTGLGCGFVRLGFPSTCAVPIAVAVYLALCACIYFRPAPTEVQLPA